MISFGNTVPNTRFGAFFQGGGSLLSFVDDGQPLNGNNAHDLLKHADMALYAAKNAGRGRYLFHEPRSHSPSRAGISTH